MRHFPIYSRALVTFMDETRKDGLSGMLFFLYRARFLQNLMAAVAITFMEGITTLRQPSVTSSGLFGEHL